jgi:hypothetical protein
MANEPKDRIGSEKQTIVMDDFSNFDSDVTWIHLFIQQKRRAGIRI